MLPQPPLWLILIAFVCALGPLVFFHELGHYLVGRLFRIPAETFSIGFGHELLGWTDRQGTRWKVAWLPLGGYVKFVGDMTPASNPADLEQIPPELRDKAFRLRPVWQRFLVVLAGPLANFLIAIAIFTAFFATIGMPSTSNAVVQVQQGSAAAAAGIRPGDRIVSVGGRETTTFEDISNIVLIRPGQKTVLAVDRHGSMLQIPITIRSAELRDRFGQKYQVGRLGILGGEQAYTKVAAWRLVPAATLYTLKITRSMMDGLWQGKASVFLHGGSHSTPPAQCARARLGLPRRPGHHSGTRRFHDNQRSRFARLMGPASTLDWIGRLGQGH